ncbi:MAG TPA: DUF1538 domain-containing protein [Epulopiscium sp.]|nr:DUF1538 domain-containing protein [Candidatus Epulonipiscium sp.]
MEVNNDLSVKETILDSVYTTLPMTIIIFILHFTIVDFPNDILINFVAGTVMVIVGLSLFSIGIDVALLEVGEEVGSSIISFKKIRHILLWAFVLGFAIALAEPNVQVLSNQVANTSGGLIAKNFLIIVVALGVAISLVLSFLRIIFNISLVKILMICYSIAFILLLFTPTQFGPVSFDAGGVVTGPLTVPFMLSLGIGVTNVTGSSDSAGDGFGILSLVFISCIIAVLSLGVFVI